MNPETLPATAAPAPVAAQPAAAPVVSITPTVPALASASAPKPALPRLGKKQRASKRTPTL